MSPLSNIFTSCTGLRASGCAAYDGLYGGYPTYNPSPLRGRINVIEGYVEVGVPLLKDKPLVRALDLDLAGRITHYSTSGTVYTWKIGPTWRVTDDFRIRLTRSQDIRAPSASELFSTVSSTVSNTSTLFPVSTAPGPVLTNTVTVQTGNLNLKPEKAQTLTIGGVYTPSWLRGFQASIDYFSIDIKDAITTIGSQIIVDQCNAGNQSYCSLITVGGAPVTSTANLNGAAGISIRSPSLNVAKVTARGLDAEVAYASAFAGGRLNLRAIGNYALARTNSASVAPNGPVYIGAYGIASAVPRWTLALREGYDHPLPNGQAVGINIEQRVIAPGHYNPNYTSAQFPDVQNRIPAYAYVNVTLRYDLPVARTKVEAYFTVQNLLNISPPPIPGATTYQTSSNFDLYDLLGQRFTLGLRVRL